MAEIIDGKSAAAQVVEGVKKSAAALGAHGVKPGLAVVIVGEDPASQVYVAIQVAQGQGMRLPFGPAHACRPTPPKHELLALIGDLNADPAIHGILVQLPLPAHIDAGKIIQTIAPDKDVDGFHFINVGKLGTGELDTAFVPCTPAGSMLLIETRARQGPVRPERRRRRPLQHRRQADGQPAARRQRHRHHRPQPHQGSAGAVPHRRHPGRRRRPARDGQGRLGQARRDRHRRRHQPRSRAGEGRGQVAAGRRRRLCRGRRACRRHHAGARRRRPDDHRHADGQHAGLGLPRTPASNARRF